MTVIIKNYILNFIMAEKFYAIFTMAVLLGFVVMLKLITVPVAVGLWVFISVVVLGA